MEEYKGNSHRDKREAQQETRQPEKRVEKIIRGIAKTQKKQGLSKLSDVFFEKDIRSVTKYLLEKVMVPSLRRFVWELFGNGLHMYLFGESDRGSNNNSSISASRVAYNSIFDRRSSRLDDQRDDRPVRIHHYSYEDILFQTRGDAELVLDKMAEILKEYRLVRVADLFDLADLTCENTDYAYGWTDLSTARAVDVRDGYVLRLPRAMPLD